MRSTFILGVLALSTSITHVLAQVALPIKQVVAPASDIESGIVQLPDPVELGVSSRTLLRRVSIEQADEQGMIDVGFPMILGDDRRSRVVFLPAKPDAWDVSLEVLTADQQSITVLNDEQAVAGIDVAKVPLPWDDAGRVYDAFTLPIGAEGFVYRIELKEQVGGYVLIDAGDSRELYTYVEQLSTLVDQPITLSSSLSDGTKIVSLVAQIQSPDGERELVRSDVDEPRVEFTPTMAGSYTVQVFAEYANQENWPVVLSTQHVIEVEAPRLALGVPTVLDAGEYIEIAFADDDQGGRVILAAELWGCLNDAMVPVCWLSRVCDDERSLFIDTRWISRAGVDPESLELRQVREHDVDSAVPTQVIDRVTIAIDRSLIRDVDAGDQLATSFRVPTEVVASEIDRSMVARSGLPGGHRLLLVHGYCSDGNPFTTSHFTGDVAIFNDPNVNRSQDGFALQMLAQTAQMKSFGVVGHSQGPMAAMHLYTYYFSGLDWARGERLIQSVGAPFTGTALAGNAAVLGDIFGAGCGENTDLTYSGASNWLSLIPTSTRQNVWYATTSFEDRPFAFDFCNLITDLLLSDPDDGVVERSNGQLSGGNNLGHTEGWCHTSGMRDPAQCTDFSRNSDFNARARR